MVRFVMQAEAATVSAAVAADLVEGAHLTVRDAGRVLELSHQRIAQFLKARAGDQRRAKCCPARLPYARGGPLWSTQSPDWPIDSR